MGECCSAVLEFGKCIYVSRVPAFEAFVFIGFRWFVCGKGYAAYNGSVVGFVVVLFTEVVRSCVAGLVEREK